MSSERIPQISRSDDEAAVRALYKQLMAGWNTGSGEAFAAPFAEDSDLIGFDGTHLKGRHAIASFHQPLFDKWLKGTRLVGEVKSVRFLSPDAALMHAVGGTVMRGKSQPSPERDSIQTLVAINRDGKWRFAAFQNTRIRPMGRNARGTFIWLFTDWLWKMFGCQGGV
ncbi:MAG: SgcJ/EcaC family oxidoreductase [Acidobacteria bacterium]|nr:SgcJ/EcaC family oxidoreductase [Acidobacteriota bacterium]MCI0719406.1 SgcJ/EcaC family oxidoreductase [Acidobacteriota bacterium]